MLADRRATPAWGRRAVDSHAGGLQDGRCLTRSWGAAGHGQGSAGLPSELPGFSGVDDPAAATICRCQRRRATSHPRVLGVLDGRRVGCRKPDAVMHRSASDVLSFDQAGSHARVVRRRAALWAARAAATAAARSGDYSSLIAQMPGCSAAALFDLRAGIQREQVWALADAMHPLDIQGTACTDFY